MQRIPPVKNTDADKNQKKQLDRIEKGLGVIPNMYRALAHSPAALKAYMDMNSALDDGVLGPEVGHRIALAVSEVHACNYCLAAHTAVGKNLKIPEEELDRARRATSQDPRIEAMLKFARMIVENRGSVGDNDIKILHEAGVTDAELSEIIAWVGMKTFANYFNHVARTEIDFPEVAEVST